MRGEYTGDNEGTHYIEELPPRARRIHTIRLPRPMLFGTTSACAENTSAVCGVGLTLGNYLRVRGEYRAPPPASHRSSELPPRARRIHHHRRVNHAESGTTSACAENTMGTVAVTGKPGNYLRVRGEYDAHLRWGRAPPELPPRARRIRCCQHFYAHVLGTTSACAENTALTSRLSASPGNYLRVRGEYIYLNLLGVVKAELPPRARRIRSWVRC